jgi:hypothetical protein
MKHPMSFKKAPYLSSDSIFEQMDFAVFTDSESFAGQLNLSFLKKLHSSKRITIAKQEANPKT